MNSSDGRITTRHAGRDALAALDLNLLTALRALLAERGVTRAAARLGLTQPGTSAALRRLRAHFDDALLVRTTTGYTLTPLAGALITPVEAALSAAETILLGRDEFRPETSTRTFTVMAADSGMVLLGERLLPRLTDAPGVTLDFVPVSDDAMDDIDETLQSVDFLVMVRGLFTGYPSTDLWSDDWVIVTGTPSPSQTTPPHRAETTTGTDLAATADAPPGPDADNTTKTNAATIPDTPPAIPPGRDTASTTKTNAAATADFPPAIPHGRAAANTTETGTAATADSPSAIPAPDYADLKWITSFHGGPAPVTARLDSWGLRPKVRAVIPSYLALPLLLAHSPGHAAILQRRLAERLSPLGGIRILPGPPDAAPIRMALWWHPSRSDDPGHTWLRNRIRTATAEMRPGPA